MANRRYLTISAPRASQSLLSSSYKDKKTFDRYAISKLSHLGLSFAELLVAYRYLSSQVRYLKSGFGLRKVLSKKHFALLAFEDLTFSLAKLLTKKF